MTLTKVIINSNLVADRVYYLLAKLKIKPANGQYPVGTTKKIVDEHHRCDEHKHECYFR